MRRFVLGSLELNLTRRTTHSRAKIPKKKRWESHWEFLRKCCTGGHDRLVCDHCDQNLELNKWNSRHSINLRSEPTHNLKKLWNVWNNCFHIQTSISMDVTPTHCKPTLNWSSLLSPMTGWRIWDMVLKRENRFCSMLNEKRFSQRNV